MKVNAINSVQVNRTKMNTRRNNSISETSSQPAVAQINDGNIAFKGTFGAIAGGVIGAVAESVLTIVTMGAASVAVLPIIAAGAVIGHSEEEKSKKEEQNNKKR